MDGQPPPEEGAIRQHDIEELARIMTHVVQPAVETDRCTKQLWEQLQSNHPAGGDIPGMQLRALWELHPDELDSLKEELKKASKDDVLFATLLLRTGTQRELSKLRKMMSGAKDIQGAMSVERANDILGLPPQAMGLGLPDAREELLLQAGGELWHSRHFHDKLDALHRAGYLSAEDLRMALPPRGIRGGRLTKDKVDELLEGPSRRSSRARQKMNEWLANMGQHAGEEEEEVAASARWHQKLLFLQGEGLLSPIQVFSSASPQLKRLRTVVRPLDALLPDGAAGQVLQARIEEHVCEGSKVAAHVERALSLAVAECNTMPSEAARKAAVGRLADKILQGGDHCILMKVPARPPLLPSRSAPAALASRPDSSRAGPSLACRWRAAR